MDIEILIFSAHDFPEFLTVNWRKKIDMQFICIKTKLVR